MLGVKWWQRLLGTGLADAVHQAQNFDVEGAWQLTGAMTLDDYIFRTGRITREEALRVPPVKRARDLICGVISQFGLNVYQPDGKVAETFTPNLFQQPEAGIAPSVTVAGLVEDMLLFKRSWFQPTVAGWHGRPIQGHKIDGETVTLQPRRIYFQHGSVEVWPETSMIRVESPNEGLLTGPCPAIRACIALERAGLNAANGVPPIDYFSPEGDSEPFTDNEDVRTRLLDPWEEARRTRTTGYVPHGVKLNEHGWDPQKLQLAEAREFAVTEVARLTGIDSEDLSVSTTSRTYFNAQDRRRDRLESVLGPYMTAIEQRFSMDDVTPRDFHVKFDTSSYLRLDDLAAAQADSVLIASKVLTRDEARTKRGLEPLGEPEQPAEPADVANALAIANALQPQAIPPARAGGNQPKELTR